MFFFHIFKNQNATTHDAVKQTMEAVTEICLKSGIPINSSWLHPKQLLKIFESWKKFKKVKLRKQDNWIITPNKTTQKDFVKVSKQCLILLLKRLRNKFLVII